MGKTNKEYRHLIETNIYPAEDVEPVLKSLDKLANDYLVWPEDQYALAWAIAFIKAHTNGITIDPPGCCTETKLKTAMDMQHYYNK